MWIESYLLCAGSARTPLNLERRIDGDNPLIITNSETAMVVGNVVSQWNWRDTTPTANVGVKPATPTTNIDNGSYIGRVILVKWGDYTRRIGVDGNAEAIKEAIKSAFGLRTKRAFWLEDEDEVVRSLDRCMPLGTYTLHLDDGVAIKVCVFDETEEKTLYTEEDFRNFLNHRGWNGLRELNGFRNVDSLGELHQGGVYQGVLRNEC